MASKYWIKLYHEILDDPKMGRLDDRYFRRTIEIFLLAGETQKDGELPAIEDMAWRLRLPLDELADDLEALQEVGILSQVNGVWFVTKFATRQAATSDAERNKQLRDRKQTEQYYRDEVRDGTVTNRNVEEEEETESESEKEKDTELTTTTTADAFRVYEQEIGVITASIADRLKVDIQDYSEGWVIDAMKVASAKQARNLPYVEAILKRWKTEGKDAGRKKPRAEPAGTSGNDAILEEIRNGKF